MWIVDQERKAAYRAALAADGMAVLEAMKAGADLMAHGLEMILCPPGRPIRAVSLGTFLWLKNRGLITEKPGTGGRHWQAM